MTRQNQSALFLPKARPIDQEILDQLPINYKKLSRASSRATTLLMQTVSQISIPVQKQVETDSFSVGIYCAIESLPIDYLSAKILAKSTETEWASIIRKNVAPKQQLKSGLGVSAAIIGIITGAMGPATNFYDRHFGVLHAVQQACIDIQEARIKVALVCGAVALDDSLLNARVVFQESNINEFREGAAALLLTEENIHLDWKKELACSDYRYGIASPLIHYLSRMGIT